MPIRKCPLCLKTKPVVSSHLMPAAVYELSTLPGGHPIAVTAEIVIESDRRVAHASTPPCEPPPDFQGGPSFAAFAKGGDFRFPIRRLEKPNGS